MGPQHRQHVADWLGEVFGGPPVYTDTHGGYPAMLRPPPRPPDHRGAAGAVGGPGRLQRRPGRAAVDPEFRSAFVAYVEWGTRLALANSAEGAAPPPAAPVPRWGWGEAPPYLP